MARKKKTARLADEQIAQFLPESVLEEMDDVLARYKGQVIPPTRAAILWATFGEDACGEPVFLPGDEEDRRLLAEAVTSFLRRRKEAIASAMYRRRKKRGATG